MNYNYSILHLSDIHIGLLSKDFKHGFAKNQESGLSEVVNKITEALGNEKPDFVAISGDLVCVGKNDKEHTESVETINGLIEKLGIKDKRRVFVVPGNHDVNRSDDYKVRLTNHIDLFMKKFYNDKEETADRIPNISFKREKDYSSFRNNRWVFKDENLPVVFVNLWSAHPFIPEQAPEWLVKAFPDPHDRWAFDRGLVPDEQLNTIGEQLKAVKGHNMIIAIVHHNLLPMIRSGFRADDHCFAESNMLANGPEVLDKMKEWGISLVLHGHRHQNYVMSPLDFQTKVDSNSIFLIGAPSIGLNTPALSQQTPTGQSTPPFDLLGFNLIKIRQSKYGEIFGEINAYRSSPGVNIAFKKQTAYPITILRGKENPINFYSSRAGLKELGNQLIDAERGVTILHYHHYADWYDENSLSPIKLLWNKVIEDEDALESLVHLIKPTSEHSSFQNTLKIAINRTLKLDHYDSSLIKFLKDIKSSVVTDALHGKHQNHAFLSLVANLPSEETRLGNYAIELLRLANDPNFYTHKCVYFWPDFKEKIVQGNTQHKWAERKMKWLVDSILASSNFKNINFSWLPYGISGHIGQSVISLSYKGQPSNKINNTWPASIFIGYGDKNLTNSSDEDRSVLFMPHNYNEHLPSGVLMRDIRVLMKKIVYPLSGRLSEDFPLYKSGKIYIDNIKLIAELFGVSVSLEGFEKNLKSRNAKLENGLTISKNKLDSLFNWVASEKMQKKKDVANSFNIPWDRDDYKFIRKKLPTNESQN